MVALLVAGCASGGTPAPTAGGAASSTPVANTGGLATGVPVTDDTKLCDLLGPGDFAAVGIQRAAAPTVNSDGPGSAYCVYAGLSSATGGIEFDAFVGDDAASVFDTIRSEGGVNLAPIDVAGADDAAGSDGEAGKDEGFASVIVRKGGLAFVIGAPGGPGMATKLVTLAKVVLERGAAFTG
jgi:hypothetical protein